MTQHTRHPTTDALIDWDFQGRGRAARCLLRYSAAVPNTALLSELAYPDPHYSPLNDDVAGATNAAWERYLSSLGFDAASMRWIIHTGLFSTHDRLWTAAHDSFYVLDVRYECGRFAFGIDDDGRRIDRNDVPFIINNVEKAVERLEAVEKV